MNWGNETAQATHTVNMRLYLLVGECSFRWTFAKHKPPFIYLIMEYIRYISANVIP